MATMGNNTTPATGSWFDDVGNKEYWTSGQYSMPTGGGVVTDMYVYCAGDGVTATAQLVIWDSSTNIVWQSGNITLPSGTRTIGGQGWQHVTVPNVYLPAGNYELGFWSSGNVVWTFEATGGVNSRASVTSPQPNTGSTNEYGANNYGALGAYVTYTPGGVGYVNTGTPAAPTWTQGQVLVNTGTPAAPTWTNAQVLVNQGTPAAPNWVNGG